MCNQSFLVLSFALDYNMNLPPWLCQSYVRDSPQEHIEKIEAKKMEMVSFTSFIIIFHRRLVFFVASFVSFDDNRNIVFVCTRL